MARSKKTVTTIKVSGKVIQFIESKSASGESIDETIRRLLRLSHNGELPQRIMEARTIKISRETMDFLLKKAKPKESRDVTLSRLLGLKPADENVRIVG